MDHPNVLKLYDVLETENDIYIILEHVKGGELFDHIIQNERLSEKESIQILGQIVMGLEHCHSHWVCHRDLKPENILLDDDNKIKIVDFGLAQVTRRWNENKLNTSCGSPHYTAPEIFSGETQYDGLLSDVWSLGVVFFAMATGTLPFNEPNTITLIELILAGDYNIPYFVTPVVAHLIHKMLSVDPKKRIKINHIRSHLAFKTNCPSLFVSRSKVSPLIPFNDSIWNKDSDLDTGIIEDLHTLGWGDVKELKTILMSEKVKKSSIPIFKSKKQIFVLIAQCICFSNNEK
eukprot:TRINITY_DN1293_c0_g1_i1.p1 TRINITY_DN1293_c0_g1~~TRINITY_DN1293_c0_g1_i1.p1  ORF type:complete len:290 (-),score=35.17 TRINITY_DN1293_c0_g1_i1:91-960(-)